jgi:hypothetical protein
MLGSPILDVAIGMTFVYLLLSLIVSVIQEIFASIIQSRSANLQRGLRSLFSGDCLNTANTIVDELYTHGLIRGLYQDPKTDYGFNVPEPASTKRWRIFFGRMRLFLRGVLRMQPPGVPKKIDDLLLPAYIPARTFALALRDILNNPTPFEWDSMRNIEQNLIDLRQKYPDNKAVEGLLTLVIDAARQPEKLQANLENWYNDAMDRVSGWYKRYVQNVLFFIGLAIAIAFNVDSVHVARALWTDKDARIGLASAASAYLNTHQDTTSTPGAPKAAITPTAPKPATPKASVAPARPETSTTIPPPGLPATEAIQAASGKPRSSGSGSASAAATLPADDSLRNHLQSSVDAFYDVAQKSMLPIGWRQSLPGYWEVYRHNLRAAIWKVLALFPGWIITAIALSLGAPLWFDTLNKFMVVRSTVKPQEKSQTERSKDN